MTLCKYINDTFHLTNIQISFVASLDTQLLLEQLQSKRGGRFRSETHLLDLKHSDARPDLVRLRNAGVKYFIVDIGADLLNIFFNQVSRNG